MARWKTKQTTVNAYKIVEVVPQGHGWPPMLVIDKEGNLQKRYPSPESLKLYPEPKVEDYWVEYETVAMPWNKAEFEKRHIKEEE